MTKTIAILYGLAEGPRLASKLVSALQKADYKVTIDAAEADVILAHSGGCFVVPRSNRSSVILLTGLPTHKGRALRRHIVKKVRHDTRNSIGQGASLKLFWNLFYIVTRPGYHFSMWRNSRIESLPTGSHIAVVNNLEDLLSEPGELEKLSKKNGWNIIDLPGGHDDLWNDPKPYIDMISRFDSLATSAA